MKSSEFTPEQINKILAGDKPKQLAGVDLSGANLGNADLRYADLQGVNLASAYLGYTILQNANLQNANLNWSILHDAVLSYANLRGASLACLRHRKRRI